MPASPDILSFPEATKFWADKINLDPQDYKRLSSQAKVRAFGVTGIAKGDELQTVRDAITKAIKSGTTLEDFKKDCADVFERRGWTGKQAWRVDNIFRTNVQSAYNAGQYQQQMATVDALPYWMYSAINDRRTRPAHALMNGRVYPASDPIWHTWYPPNGYRCRCSVIALTESQVNRRGLKISDSSVGQAPSPDPGFEANQGESYFIDLGDALTERATTWEPEVTKSVLEEIVKSPEVDLWLDSPSGQLPIATTSDGIPAVIREQELGKITTSISAIDLEAMQEQLFSAKSSKSIIFNINDMLATFILIDGMMVLTEVEQ